VVRAPPEITLVRGRTEPLEAGRGVEAATVLDEAVEALPEGLAVVEGLLLVDGLLPVEGLPPEAGLAPDEGFEVVEGELADGAGFSAAGGDVTWATGALPPEERL
jgi:hypothetical protein